MVSLNNIIRFLNKELKPKSVQDDSLNGLQIRGKSEVKRIAFGVDACMDLFEKAKKNKCDLIIVHHGLKWKKKKIDPKRIKFLEKNKISLYGMHLPLDMHEVYGNNIQLANIIGLNNPKRFGIYNKKMIGFYGELNSTVKDVAHKLDKALKTKSMIHNFGQKNTKRIAIVSGGAWPMIDECKKLKIDTYISGEPFHTTFHFEKEAKLNVIYPGHYKTETVGVKALQKLIKEKFNIETIFIDIPTGL